MLEQNRKRKMTSGTSLMGMENHPGAPTTRQTLLEFLPKLSTLFSTRYRLWVTLKCSRLLKRKKSETLPMLLLSWFGKRLGIVSSAYFSHMS
jgi:hypothetical protein